MFSYRNETLNSWHSSRGEESRTEKGLEKGFSIPLFSFTIYFCRLNQTSIMQAYSKGLCIEPISWLTDLLCLVLNLPGNNISPVRVNANFGCRFLLYLFGLNKPIHKSIVVIAGLEILLSLGKAGNNVAVIITSITSSCLVSSSSPPTNSL